MNEIPKGRSVTIDMAHRFGMEPANFEKVLRATVVPANCSPEQFAAFLLVAKQYSLNPITKEIYAFPAKGGGIQPIVGIDGWIRIINDQPAMDGMTFQDHFKIDGGDLTAISCSIYRKDRQHPTIVTEYMEECSRDTEPWKKWPARMLRHKAAIQAARYAFGFSGIIDPDEYERGVGRDVSHETVMPPPPPSTKPVPAEYRDMEEDRKHLVEVINREPEASSELETIEDPDAYLDDLDSKMAGAETHEILEEIWEEHMAAKEGLLPPDQDKADFILGRHENRIRATIAAKASKKK